MDALVRVSRVAAVMLALLPFSEAAATARTVVDAIGRTVTVPDIVTRVLPAGPPADLLVYSVAPGKLVGMVRPWTADQKPYVPAAYQNLAAVPRVNRDMTPAQLQAIRDLKPDLIIDYGDVTPDYKAIADAIQASTGIPYVLIDGSVPATAAAYRTAGTLLGANARADQVATFVEQTIAKVNAAKVGTTPKGVYLSRGDDALQGVRPKNVNGEVPDDAGAKGVVPNGDGTFVTLTPDQVKALKPDIGIVGSDKGGTALAALVPGAMVLVDTNAPMAWIENPPSVNRVVGLLWLGSVLYPDKLKPTTADYQAAWKTLFGFDVSADAITAKIEPRP